MNKQELKVLNLIINGIPSIPVQEAREKIIEASFKPYYKWNTFNTIITEKIIFKNLEF